MTLLLIDQGMWDGELPEGGKRQFQHRGRAIRDFSRRCNNETKNVLTGYPRPMGSFSLFASEADWEQGVLRLKEYTKEAPTWKAKMREGKQGLLDTLAWYGELSLLSERVGCYAMLRYSADASDPKDVRMYGLASQTLSELGSALSWFEPQLLALDDQTLRGYLDDTSFAPYRIWLSRNQGKTARPFRPEERLPRHAVGVRQTPHLAFSDLTMWILISAHRRKPLSRALRHVHDQSRPDAPPKWRTTSSPCVRGTPAHHRRLYEGS
jgi:hypothetical protein